MRNMLFMVTGAAWVHKVLFEDHADAEYETGPSDHGKDLGFGLISEWTFLEKNNGKNRFSWDPAEPRTSTFMIIKFYIYLI